jgi:plasmid stabilization system protein ParE
VKRGVRVATGFRKDLRAQLAWLSVVDEGGWIEGLREGLDEAFGLLAEHPGVGSLEAKEGSSELRRIVLRRVPYIVWYATKGGDVWILRLFHARQHRPKPSWPPATTVKKRSRRSSS